MSVPKGYEKRTVRVQVVYDPVVEEHFCRLVLTGDHAMLTPEMARELAQTILLAAQDCQAEAILKRTAVPA